MLLRILDQSRIPPPPGGTKLPLISAVTFCYADPRKLNPLCQLYGVVRKSRDYWGAEVQATRIAPGKVMAPDSA